MNGAVRDLLAVVLKALVLASPPGNSSYHSGANFFIENKNVGLNYPKARLYPQKNSMRTI